MSSAGVDKLTRRAELEAASGKMDLVNAIMAYQSRNFKAAILFTERSLNHTPEDLVLYQLLSHCFTELNQRDDALRAMRKALELSPNDDETWRAVIGLEAQLAMDTGRLPEGLSQAQKHLENSKRARNRLAQFWALVALSDLCRAMGRHTESLDYQREALPLTPSEKQGKFRALGMGINVAREEEDFEECLKLASEAIEMCKDTELNESPTQFHRARAQLLWLLQRPEEALVEARLVAKLDPTSKEAQELLTVVCLCLDRKKEALKAQERIAQLEPYNTESREACARLLASVEASRIDVD